MFYQKTLKACFWGLFGSFCTAHSKPEFVKEKLASPVLRFYRPLTSCKNETKLTNQYREKLYTDRRMEIQTTKIL